ncbi:BrnT family toxin [Pseudomonas seleniipraecipitans]|uniref:BrnT family toxin n=1 Tax=Phytopseudomonas seleniipraecipitans TaxID=640205 RepID=A0ABY5JDN1_9GAMM|nr:BrnT family toxin [Pseudomonas seleniipraecipitans]
MCPLFLPFFSQERWISIGWIKVLIGVVVYTERRGDVIRIISARKATKQEAKHYVESIEN